MFVSRDKIVVLDFIFPTSKLNLNLDGEEQQNCYNTSIIYVYFKILSSSELHEEFFISGAEKDIFSHISRLWNSYIKSGNIKNFNTSQALGNLFFDYRYFRS